MRYAQVIAAVALPLATQVVGSPSGERRTEVVTEKPWHAPLRRWADTIRKRQTCGQDVGDCPEGECCSESGYCGSTTDFCKSPACQIEFSNGNCDAE